MKIENDSYLCNIAIAVKVKWSTNLKCREVSCEERMCVRDRELHFRTCARASDICLRYSRIPNKLKSCSNLNLPLRNCCAREQSSNFDLGLSWFSILTHHASLQSQSNYEVICTSSRSKCQVAPYPGPQPCIGGHMNFLPGYECWYY